MNLTLITQPQLLRQRFAFTREALLGVWVMPSDIGVGRTTSSSGKSQNKRLEWGSVKSWLARFVVSLLVVGGLTITTFFAAPQLYYQLVPSSVVAVQSQDASSPLGGSFEAGTNTDQAAEVLPQVSKPPVNPDLPAGQWLSIPRIGVRSSFEENEDSAQALETGLWMVPEFGRPG